ncbi:MAG TPA: YceI family protein [Anaeromyxobacteraceae bacterium]|nr:YceI family protein [Anaeromyxobacteraceae bacterium]
MKRIALAALALAAAPALADTASYTIDPAHAHSSFTVRHLVISNVRGEFGKTEGTAIIDDADLAKSKVEAKVDVSTIDTREPKRDAHLKSPDFFDVAKFPAMTFKSTKVEKAGDGRLKVTGDLTIKGVTRPVVLDVTGPTKEIKDPWGNVRRGISASTRINRKDFGVSWGAMVEAGPVVGDEVNIEIEAELLKDQAKK